MRRSLLLVAFLSFSAISALSQTISPFSPEARELLQSANLARQQAGAGPLVWDAALAQAAMKHCRRMVAEGEIAHRYGGELDLAARAGAAGAHFDLIEENIAVAPDAESVHQGWMHSPPHRLNLLNPKVDRVGIAILPSRGVLYAVADYAHGAESYSSIEAEGVVAGSLRQRGVEVSPNHADARRACAMDSGLPESLRSAPPAFVMRWQSSTLAELPAALARKLTNHHLASVGACPADTDQSGFTMYRMAVLLY